MLDIDKLKREAKKNINLPKRIMKEVFYGIDWAVDVLKVHQEELFVEDLDTIRKFVLEHLRFKKLLTDEIENKVNRFFEKIMKIKTKKELIERIKEFGVKEKEAKEYAKKINYYFSKICDYNLNNTYIDIVDLQDLLSSRVFHKNIIASYQIKTNIKTIMKNLNLKSKNLAEDLMVLEKLGLRFEFELTKKQKDYEVKIDIYYLLNKDAYEVSVLIYKGKDHKRYILYTQYLWDIIEVLQKIYKFSYRDLEVVKLFLNVGRLELKHI